MGPQDNVSRRSLLYDKTYSDSLQSSLFVHFKLIKETTLNTSVFNHKVHFQRIDFQQTSHPSSVQRFPRSKQLFSRTKYTTAHASTLGPKKRFKKFDKHSTVSS
eukprot:TRINITY_DN9_c0_g2_i12.p1 TRINITY_DN9_c0_g2~~TRINITY_DN9_c0_g2_i12.p1  ORF type:complete len:104 (-),score=8.78 TRINITY_DN9_c0_g2_i12:6-317(-)